GFKFIAWDGELTLNSPTQNRVSSTDTASGLHTKLVANTEYRLDFADRVHKHLFNGGVLTPGVIAARYQKRIDEVDLAMIAESARWGDYRRDVHQYQTPPYELYTHNIHFLNEKNRLLTQYFPGRTTTVLNQLRTAGLYPATAAPAFSQHGGRVALGFNLAMSAPAGMIYYTTNGSDPRVIYTGAISASARTYGGPVALNNTVLVKARALNGSEWSALNEALFQVEELGVPLRITEIMYNPIGGDPYEFLEIQNVGATTIDVSGFALDGVSFVFPPNSVLASGQIVVLASSLSPSSFAARYPGVSILGYFDDGLNNGGERIALLDRGLQTVTSVDYDDGNGWPSAANGGGPSLEIIDARGDPDDPANWRASAGNNGSPGSLTAPPALGAVRLNEIMADNLGAVTNGAAFPDWIELQNTGGGTVSLSGWSLTDDGNPRKFVFPASASIAAGGYLIVWCDSDFAAPGLHAGFALGRGGESVFLYDSGTNRMDAVTFGLQIPNLTVGRVGAGAGTWQLCQATPNAANVAQSLAPVSNLVINEWLAKPAPGGDDWIELHNRHVTLPASLQGSYLTASNATFRIQSLSFVAAAGFAQLIADENAGADHLDFKIAAEGGTIALYDTAGAEINRVNYGLQAEGVSEGRLPNGSATIVSFSTSASPGASNYLITYAGPTLNEVMAWNTGAVTNPVGRVADWIELFNPGGATFSMAGMSLSDEPGTPGQWIFPAGVSVPANGYLVIWFDGDQPASTNLQANLNTGRSLDRRSGGVWLYNSAGQIVDFVEYGFQVENRPIGKNGGQWELLDSPTPGTANASAATLGPVVALRINEWMANPASGDDWFELHNASDQPVSLASLHVSDDLTIVGQTNSSIAPISFIGPRGFVKFEADGSPGRGRDHTGFQLDSLGEAIVLLDASLSVIDGVYFGAQTPGASAGRLPDGGDTMVSFSTTSSPDASNYLPLPNAVINEVLSHTDLPLEDAVELHNPTAAPVDISGWFLSDDPANFKKLQVPAGTVLSASGDKVIYENQLNGGAGSLVPFTFDSVRGDEVWLSAADGVGNLTGYRSVARFGASANGVSFGRYLTSVGEDFVAMTQHTFGVSNPSSVTQFRTGAGAANANPLVGPVVINEIMYHPVNGSGLTVFEPAEEEFIELQNITGGAVSLYDPAHLTNTWRLGGGIEFAFPGGVTLPAQSHLLVVNFDPVTN
ncbi:MAG TPA: lamin tail domain-containing protein, partial [Verrucomicrobiae bacterium]|nr:lamin tail domain-containing protein [Verrucomicrobiae bacterium]